MSSKNSISAPPLQSPLESFLAGLILDVSGSMEDDSTVVVRIPSTSIRIVSDPAKLPSQRLLQQANRNLSLSKKRTTLARLPSPQSITDDIFVAGNLYDSPRSARWSAMASPRTPLSRAGEHAKAALPSPTSVMTDVLSGFNLASPIPIKSSATRWNAMSPSPRTPTPNDNSATRWNATNASPLPRPPVTPNNAARISPQGSARWHASCSRNSPVVPSADEPTTLTTMSDVSPFSYARKPSIDMSSKQENDTKPPPRYHGKKKWYSPLTSTTAITAKVVDAVGPPSL